MKMTRREQSSAMKSLADISRNAPFLERQPRDGLPALMMADQKGNRYDSYRKKDKY